MDSSVLIVDDDAGFRRAATELLTSRGYRVVGHAASAREALARATELEPDAVLLDVGLPDGDGVQVAAELSLRPNRLNVLLISTDPEAVPSEHLDRCGASGFVAKADLVTADIGGYLNG